MAYDHNLIDSKWQKLWAENHIFKAEYPSDKPKYYALDMFPYPSGTGLHVGHLASYTPTDVIARFKRAKGFNVLHPMGYDAFGLPAEQYAIQTGVHPETTTQKAIKNFRRQLESFGYSFDWERTVSTSDPNFYKWTQFIFSKLFKQGLAYQKEVPVNWCPELKTVLANEEVVDGKSERGGYPVIRMPMKQWMLKITDYAEKLIAGLDTVDFPQRTKEGQKNWIGKSFGAELKFKIKGKMEFLEVFTTRPDTLFGVSFMVVAPEHTLLLNITTPEKKNEVQKYIESSNQKSELERKANTEKSGCFIGAFAIHPVTQKEIPVWVADYVLADYGTGAIMAVPAHDERDFEFAQKFGLNVVKVVENPHSQEDLPFVGRGRAINSDFLNGLDTEKAVLAMGDYLEKHSLGKKTIVYKLRDWLFSRQRYWGEPFPIIKNNKGQLKPLDLEELPVTLPDVADYEPSAQGEAPLARNKDWVNYSKEWKRDTDTMPGSAGSSWYFLRYCDPHNPNELASLDAQKYWMPVDLYLGGPEHTVGHLLYSRFWQRFLYEQGLATTPEPYVKLAHQGMILGPDGEKMSKSQGNVINPDEVREKFGADAVRTYICFLGPYDRDKPWNTAGISGVRKFIDRVWRLVLDENFQLKINDETIKNDKILSLMHRTIKKVEEDIESLNFNTAVSAMMIYVNELYKLPKVSQSFIRPLVQIMAPFAPHVSEELWNALRKKDSKEDSEEDCEKGSEEDCEKCSEKCNEKNMVTLAPWPTYDPTLCEEEVITLAVQVNGKTRGTIEIQKEISEDQAIELAMGLKSVQLQVKDKKILKIIYKAGKILNFIAK